MKTSTATRVGVGRGESEGEIARVKERDGAEMSFNSLRRGLLVVRMISRLLLSHIDIDSDRCDLRRGHGERIRERVSQRERF